MENLSKIEQEKYDQAKKRVKTLKGFYTHLIVYIVINTFIIIANAQYKTLETFFTFGTFSTAIAWGVGLIGHAFSVFSNNLILGKNWEERKMQELIEKYKRE